MKKLYRSQDNKMLAGVLAGFAEYCDADPTIIRAAFVFITFITGFFPGVLAYIVMTIITPTKSEVEGNGKKDSKA